MKPITVIGGANVDLCGTPRAAVVARDSNPGRVQVTAGGVGRNIAQNLSGLGLPTRLVTALGADAHGAVIRASCAQAGVDLSLAMTFSSAATSCYLCLNDENGDLLLAVSDMAICDLLTPDALEPLLPELNQSALCVLDANLPRETVDFLARRLTVPLSGDPVSVAKARRLMPALSRMLILKPNVPEAEALTGLSRAAHSAEAIARRLHEMGVARVFLSLGGSGVYYLDEAAHGHLPCYRGPVVDTTGCGDAFLASALSATLEGMDIRTSATRALAASALRAAGRAVSLPDAMNVIKDGGVYP